LPLKKQLFILDACQSGGAVKSFAQRGAVREKALAQLARSGYSSDIVPVIPVHMVPLFA